MSIALVLSGCSMLTNTNVPLATCSDAVAAIDIATSFKQAGKLNLAQEKTIETGIATLEPVCGSATPQTLLSAAESAALASITSITGTGSVK